MLNFMAAFKNSYYIANQRYFIDLKKAQLRKKTTSASRKKKHRTKSKESEILCGSLFETQNKF